MFLGLDNAIKKIKFEGCFSVKYNWLAILMGYVF